MTRITTLDDLLMQVDGPRFVEFQTAQGLIVDVYDIHSIAQPFTLPTGKDEFSLVLGGSGNDTIFANGNGSRIYGFDGKDHINGSAGRDIVFGGDGNDTVFGQGGDDIIHGGDGFDYLYGNGGNDHITGGGLNDLLTGGAGDDYIWGGTGNDFLIGGDDDDTMHGGEGIDVLSGESGNDRMTGGEGDDFLIGGTGINTLTGGSGLDYFQLDAGGFSLITDFTQGDDFIGLLAGTTTIFTAGDGEVADIRWTVDASTTGHITDSPDIANTHLFLTQGTLSESDDVLVMVLEDLADPLAAVDFL